MKSETLTHQQTSLRTIKRADKYVLSVHRPTRSRRRTANGKKEKEYNNVAGAVRNMALVDIES